MIRKIKIMKKKKIMIRKIKIMKKKKIMIRKIKIMKKQFNEKKVSMTTMSSKSC